MPSNGKNKGRGAAVTVAASCSRASDRPTPKLYRESEEHVDSDTEALNIDPEQLLDSLLGCLTNKESLLHHGNVSVRNTPQICT